MQAYIYLGKIDSKKENVISKHVCEILFFEILKSKNKNETNLLIFSLFSFHKFTQLLCFLQVSHGNWDEIGLTINHTSFLLFVQKSGVALMEKTPFLDTKANEKLQSVSLTYSTWKCAVN